MSRQAPGRKRSHLLKLVRFGSVSVIFTVLNFIGLAILVGGLNFPAGWASFLLILLSIPPAFLLNRRWVWDATGGPWWQSPEVVPFGAFALLGLAMSTFAVHRVGLMVPDWSRVGRTVAVEAASVSASGSLWLIEYFVFDKVLFKAQGSEERAIEPGRRRRSRLETPIPTRPAEPSEPS
jgi:putative flippase GtrA